MLNMITANMELPLICNSGSSHHSDICLRHHNLELIMHFFSIVTTKNIPVESGFGMTTGSGRRSLELTGGQNSESYQVLRGCGQPLILKV
jgi:hypothetical protein